MHSITKGIRKLKRPKWTQIQLPNKKGGKTYLCAMQDSELVCVPISKRAAEILIATGVGYGS